MSSQKGETAHAIRRRKKNRKRAIFVVWKTLGNTINSEKTTVPYCIKFLRFSRK